MDADMIETTATLAKETRAGGRATRFMPCGVETGRLGGSLALPNRTSIRVYPN